MEIKRATERDIAAVAAINIEAVPEGLRAAMGVELMTAFFRAYYDEGAPIVVALSDGIAVGYVAGYYRGSQARKRFETEYAATIHMRLTESAERGNAAALRFLARQQELQISAVAEPDITQRYDSVLFSLCVLPAYAGRGIAQSVIVPFQACLREHGARNNCLETQVDNIAAQHAYCACGYREIQRSGESLWYGINFD